MTIVSSPGFELAAASALMSCGVVETLYVVARAGPARTRRAASTATRAPVRVAFPGIAASLTASPLGGACRRYLLLEVVVKLGRMGPRSRTLTGRTPLAGLAPLESSSMIARPQWRA